MKRATLVVCFTTLVLVGIAVISQDAPEVTAQEATDLIAEANVDFDRWTEPFDFASYQERFETAIALRDQALPLLPEDNVASRAHVLNHLAQAYFELGEAYLVEPAERGGAYGNGKNGALASLRLDPLFGTTEETDGFRAALRSASDVVAIFRYGNTLGCGSTSPRSPRSSVGCSTCSPRTNKRSSSTRPTWAPPPNAR
jgi:hypothetical protein